MFTRTTRLLVLAVGLAFVPAGFAQTFDLSWYTIDGGGAMFTMGAGGLELSGTIGQFDAGQPMTGGPYELTGGFWAFGAATGCPGSRGDANCDGSVDFFDIDPFLGALFDPPTYASMFCGGQFCAVDTDCSGSVDFFDIDPFLNCLFSGCAPCP